MKKSAILAFMIVTVMTLCSCSSNVAPMDSSAPTEDIFSLEVSSVSNVEPSEPNSSVASENTSVPSQTSKPTSVPDESKTTSSATTAPSDKNAPAWKGMYSRYLQIVHSKFDRFALVYVDNDDVPELYASGSAGDQIFAIRGNSIIYGALDGQNGAHYIAKSGKLVNVYVDGDKLTMKIYRLTTYFEEIFTGYEYRFVNTDGTQTCTFYIDGSVTPLTEPEFKTEVAKVFNTDAAVNIKSNAVSYEQIQKQLS